MILRRSPRDVDLRTRRLARREPKLAGYLRIEERELEAGELN
jgi:hypothetical protein